MCLIKENKKECWNWFWDIIWLYPLVPMMSSSVMEPDGSNMTSSECSAGEELMGDSCTACRSGFYKSETGNGTCTRCPQNTDTNGRTGGTQCSEYLFWYIVAPDPGFLCWRGLYLFIFWNKATCWPAAVYRREFLFQIDVLKNPFQSVEGRRFCTFRNF